MALPISTEVNKLLNNKDGIKKLDYMMLALTEMDTNGFKLRKTDSGHAEIIVFTNDDWVDKNTNDGINNFYFNSKEDGKLYANKDYAMQQAREAIKSCTAYADKASQIIIDGLRDDMPLMKYTDRLYETTLKRNSSNTNLFLNYPDYIEKFASEEIKTSPEFAIKCMTFNRDFNCIAHLNDSVKDDLEVLKKAVSYLTADREYNLTRLKSSMSQAMQSDMGNMNPVDYIESLVKKTEAAQHLEATLPKKDKAQALLDKIGSADEVKPEQRSTRLKI